MLIELMVILDTSKVIASDADLSKMTALLIAAGLWPPPEEQIWNDTFLWQPVPYVYPPREEDYVSIFLNTYYFLSNEETGSELNDF